MARTDTLGNFLTDVADAIREKKGTEESIIASNFDEEIRSIESSSSIDFFATGDNISTSQYYGRLQQIFSKIPYESLGAIQGANYLFSGMTNLEEIDLSKINFNDQLYMEARYVFYRCEKLTGTIDISDFGQNINSLEYGFYQCKKLNKVIASEEMIMNSLNINHTFYGSGCTEIDLSKVSCNNINTSGFQSSFTLCGDLISVKLPRNTYTTAHTMNISEMFASCGQLKSVDMGYMYCGNYGITGSQTFMDCTNLETIDMSQWTANFPIGSQMFQNCTSLNKIDMRNLTVTSVGTNSFTNVPTTCTIIVKDEASKEVLTTALPDFTNIMTLEEYQAEGGE